MIRRSTWVVLAIFAILLAVVLLLPKLKLNEPEPTPTLTPTLESPFSFAVGDVVEFRVESLEGKTVITDRSADNGWQLVEPSEKISESNNVEGVVAGVVNINLLSKIDPAPPTDISGVEPPMYSVTMVNKNGDEEGFSIGNLTPTSSGYYILTDDGQVYVADKTKIDQVIDLVLSPPIETTPTPTQLDMESEVPSITSTVEPEISISPEATQPITQTIETTSQNITSTTPTP